MEEIYVLITGEYSDWRIEGFVKSEEEAIKTCLKFNEEHNGETNLYTFRNYDDMYYMKVELFTYDNLDTIHPYYSYRINAYKKNDGWFFGNKDEVEVYYYKNNPNINNKVNIRKSNSPWFGDSATIEFSLNTLNRDKALKVAQDILYKKLAEENNL